MCQSLRPATSFKKTPLVAASQCSYKIRHVIKKNFANNFRENTINKGVHLIKVFQVRTTSENTPPHIGFSRKFLNVELRMLIKAS